MEVFPPDRSIDRSIDGSIDGSIDRSPDGSIDRSIALGLILATSLFGCDSADNHTDYITLTNPTGLGIVRQPEPFVLDRAPLHVLPSYNPASTDSFQVDLRSRDLSALDLTDRSDDLSFAVFDSKTVWPPSLPADFSPSAILEIGKNPGLAVRSLHERGTTGKGIGIAIIDQPLLVDHTEYADRLKCYEEIHWPTNNLRAQMHGPAVASIAVGKTVGVAPEADLYFIAEQHGTWSGSTFDWDFTWLAQAIDRVLAINTLLPGPNRIRVISISVGWTAEQKGYAEVTAAVARAFEAGIFVVSSSISETYGYHIHGLGRTPLADPDQADSYGPGSWWADQYFAQGLSLPADTLLAPMDSRTMASFTGKDDYLWGRVGGWSWVVPYLAGVYALACQVKPDITPDLFWNLAVKTGSTITVAKAGTATQFRTILAPAKLIDELTK